MANRHFEARSLAACVALGDNMAQMKMRVYAKIV